MEEKSDFSVDGTWQGAAVAEGASLEVRLNLTTLPGDILQATIDFPSWNSLDTPLSNVRYEHPFLHFEIAGAKDPDTFEGQVTGNSISGELTLWGRTAQVHLRRNPLPPRYHQEEVAFGEGNRRLAGTLLRPDGNGPFPAVIFIAGSGPQTRASSRGMADLFVRRGMAALIYDKRGTGSSSGDWREATFEYLAQDAAAAVHALKNRNDIYPNRIGLHGTSQGGWIAHRVSSSVPDLAFVVTVASPVVTPAQQALYEITTRLQKKGFSEREILQAIAFKQRFDEYARTGEDRQELETAIENHSQEPWFTVMEDLPSPLPPFQQLGWWRSVMDFDPLPYILRGNCPLLAIFGGRDALINSQESAHILQGLSAERDITVRVFEKANHALMVFPEPGEEFRWFGFADHYLDTVISWVESVFE